MADECIPMCVESDPLEDFHLPFPPTRFQNLVMSAEIIKG